MNNYRVSGTITVRFRQLLVMAENEQEAIDIVVDEIKSNLEYEKWHNLIIDNDLAAREEEVEE